MSASEAEVARPTLRPRGLLGVAEPILTAGGRAVGQHTEAFVGIDAAKARNAVAVAEGGRPRARHGRPGGPARAKVRRGALLLGGGTDRLGPPPVRPPPRARVHGR